CQAGLSGRKPSPVLNEAGGARRVQGAGEGRGQMDNTRGRRGGRAIGFGAVRMGAIAGGCGVRPPLGGAPTPGGRAGLVRGEITGSVPSARPWSGEAGASGHPLMTPAAILAAASNFQNCIAQLWPQAARRGVSWQTFRTYTANLEPDLHIMDLLDAQPELTK